MTRAAHHVASIDNLVRALEPDPSIHALVLGGSLAHGFARPDSDIDVAIVVDAAEYARRTAENRLHYNDTSLCTYAGGYIDGKYVDVGFLRQVAASGSDPARYAFQDAEILFSRVPELPDLLAEITRYPAHEREERCARFAAQLLAWRWYHSESVRKQSRYLEVLALGKLVLFTCRLVLAANEQLYPFHKWMLRVTETVEHRPPDLMDRLQQLLTEPTPTLVDEHVRAMLDFYGIDFGEVEAVWPSRFMKDTELTWMSGGPSADDL